MGEPDYAFPPFSFLCGVINWVFITPGLWIWLVASGRVVCSSPDTTERSAIKLPPWLKLHSPVSTMRSQVPQGNPFPATSFKVIQHLLQEKGFSCRAAWEMLGYLCQSFGKVIDDKFRSWRPSTGTHLQYVYQGKWVKFCDWCLSRDTSLFGVSVQQLSFNFATDLQTKGTTPSHFGVFIHVTKRFQRVLLSPWELGSLEWDVSLLLESFKRPPFEPLSCFKQETNFFQDCISLGFGHSNEDEMGKFHVHHILFTARRVRNRFLCPGSCGKNSEPQLQKRFGS